MIRHSALLAAALSLVLLTPVFAAGDADQGVLPVGTDGKPLNLDLESGNLNGWQADGEAFQGQPVKGDTPTKRGRGRSGSWD